MNEQNKPSGARRWLRAAAAAVGACALVAVGATVVPAATTSTTTFYTVHSAQAEIGPGTNGSVGVGCKTGGHATGGGYTITPLTAPAYVEESFPGNGNVPPISWTVFVYNPGTITSLGVTAWVVCEHL
jgi:hypothetical protein